MYKGVGTIVVLVRVVGVCNGRDDSSGSGV